MALIDTPEQEHDVWRSEWPIWAGCLALVGSLVAGLTLIIYWVAKRWGA